MQEPKKEAPSKESIRFLRKACDLINQRNDAGTISSISKSYNHIVTWQYGDREKKFVSSVDVSYVHDSYRKNSLTPEAQIQIGAGVNQEDGEYNRELEVFEIDEVLPPTPQHRR